MSRVCISKVKGQDVSAALDFCLNSVIGDEFKKFRTMIRKDEVPIICRGCNAFDTKREGKVQ